MMQARLTSVAATHRVMALHPYNIRQHSNSTAIPARVTEHNAVKHLDKGDN